jgi:hypothetical protein
MEPKSIRWGCPPTGAVLWSNVVSEVAFGNAFTVTALVGALMLLFCPQDVDPSEGMREIA